MDEKRITLAKYRITKAREEIESAKYLLEKGLLQSSILIKFFRL